MGGTAAAAAAAAGSGSTVVQNSRSDGDLQALMDQRKRKRMISNRKSASRSRMRKQKHLEDLMAHSAQLQGENHQLISAMNVATQQYLAVETENRILRVQIDELRQRLRSLNEIISFSGSNSSNSSNGDCQSIFDGFMNPMITGFVNHQQLIFTSAGIFQY